MSQLLVDHLLCEDGSTIDFEERASGLKESFIANQLVQERVFLVDWSERWDFVINCLGEAKIVNDQLVRTVPVISEIGTEQVTSDNTTFLVNPDAYDLFATELVKIQGKGPRQSESPNPAYEYAEITLRFTQPVYPILSDAEIGTTQDVYQSGGVTTPLRYVSSRGTRIYFEYPLKVGHLVYKDTGSYAVNAVEKKQGQILLAYTWHRVPSRTLGVCSQLDNILPAIGCCNSDFFDGWPPESLLLVNVSTFQYWHPDAQYTSDITFQFKHLDQSFAYDGIEYPLVAYGHNHFFRFHNGDSGVYRFTSNGDDTGYPTYSPINFMNLFQV